MSDYLLGGRHHSVVDRAAASQALAQMPDLPSVLGANWSFARRAVRHLVDRGIRQFLDLGSGVPTVGNVHQTARRADPTSRVVYVDADPVAAPCAETILDDGPAAAMVRGDLRNLDGILADPTLRAMVDLDRPIGVILVGVLHLIADPAELVAQLYRAVAPGSYLALSHLCPEERQTPRGMRQARAVYLQSGNPLYPRTLHQIEALLSGWRLEPPGLVASPQWRPDPGTEPLNPHVTFPFLVGLAYKPIPRPGAVMKRKRPAMN
jgi:SAM-dependent methyltransferase